MRPIILFDDYNVNYKKLKHLGAGMTRYRFHEKHKKYFLFRAFLSGGHRLRRGLEGEGVVLRLINGTFIRHII